MRESRARSSLLVLIALTVATAFACGDDAGSGGSGGSSTTTGTGSTTTGDTTTGTTTGSTTTSSSTGTGMGGEGGQGGENPGDSGAQSTEFVSAGDVATSQSYRLVFTMGQPTQNQEIMTSPNHRLIGGFVGATGSP